MIKSYQCRLNLIFRMNFNGKAIIFTSEPIGHFESGKLMEKARLNVNSIRIREVNLKMNWLFFKHKEKIILLKTQEIPRFYSQQ